MNAITNDAKFLDILRASPPGVAAVEAERKRVVAERRKPVEALAALERRAEADYLRLDKAEQVEVAATRAAEAALRAQNEKLRLAALAKSGASHAATAERHRLEQLLRASPVDAAIDAFLDDMRLEATQARKKFDGGRIPEHRPFARDPGQRVIWHPYPNTVSVNARLAAIDAAMAFAEESRFAIDQDGVVARLDALRAALPPVVAPVIPAIPAEAR
jgi:hypothetical protein